MEKFISDGTRIDLLPEKDIMPIRRRCGFLFQMGHCSIR